MTKQNKPDWSISWSHYDDIGDVLELGAVYDDALKKNTDFVSYGVMLANRILESKKLKIRASWGKWGARLEPSLNPDVSKEQLENAANMIQNHPAWKALTQSTKPFTYGYQDESISEFQEKCKNCGEYGHYYWDCKKPPTQKLKELRDNLSEIIFTLQSQKTIAHQFTTNR